jgi:hypothetical protein
MGGGSLLFSRKRRDPENLQEWQGKLMACKFRRYARRRLVSEVIM